MSVRYPTKVALALRSGNACAMPRCGQLLSELQGNEFVLLGVAAHIAGERGDGTRGHPSARFDPEMTPEERNSLSNLLYLCQKCHTKIDAHPHGERDYPVARLLKIKAEHEEAVAAAMYEAMASVSFAELETATRWVTEVPPPPPVDLPGPLGRVAMDQDLDQPAETPSAHPHAIEEFISRGAFDQGVGHLVDVFETRQFVEQVGQLPSRRLAELAVGHSAKDVHLTLLDPLPLPALDQRVQTLLKSVHHLCHGLRSSLRQSFRIVPQL